MKFRHAIALAEAVLYDRYETVMSLEEARRSFTCMYSGLEAVMRLQSRPPRAYPQELIKQTAFNRVSV